MTKLSRSPQRHSFLHKSKEGNLDTEFLDKILAQDLTKEADPEWAVDNLEYDLRTTDWILEKVRESKTYAQHLYAAMCNNEFQRAEMWPILTDKKWSCSWRYAGGIVAHMRQEGDYIDWYCSGIRNIDLDSDEYEGLTEQQKSLYNESAKFVSESTVTDEIAADLKRLGWLVVDDE